MTAQKPQIIARHLGLIDYAQCHSFMKSAINSKKPYEQSEIWFVEHPSILTQGQAGKAEHLLQSSSIQCYQSDRGGQITYHGPGQLICYFLLHLKPLGLTAHALVQLATDLIVDVLKEYAINSHTNRQNPGVYTPKTSKHGLLVKEASDQDKIASVGFRIRHQMSYHGIALNVNMDLSGFQGINPCGLKGQSMSQMADFFHGKASPSMESIKKHFIYYLEQALTPYTITETWAWPSSCI